MEGFFQQISIDFSRFQEISGCREEGKDMGTIVNSLSNFFYDFYEGEAFSMEKATRFFDKYADRERHTDYVREVYETILSSPAINETSKILIRTRKSYAETARYYNSLHQQEIAATAATETTANTADSTTTAATANTDNTAKPRRPKTPELVKADIYYTNRKLGNILQNYRHNTEYPQRDFFTLILYQREISDTLWDKADEALENLKITLNGKLISKETFWLNIPVREFNRELSEQEFSQLIEIIRPYFNSQKAIAQLKLNSMKKEAGYLNYILKANMGNSLSEVDLARRNIILSLSDKEQIQRFKQVELQDQSLPPTQTDSPLYQYQLQLSKLREEAEQEKHTRMEIMSRVGLIYHQTGGKLSEKHQFAVDTLGKQYDQLKQISQGKQKKIDQLQIKLQELSEQLEEK